MVEKNGEGDPRGVFYCFANQEGDAAVPLKLLGILVGDFFFVVLIFLLFLFLLVNFILFLLLCFYLFNFFRGLDLANFSLEKSCMDER